MIEVAGGPGVLEADAAAAAAAAAACACNKGL